ncbi:hypothetical protein DAEQUDRAFT_780038 [Daedalea quercina L-15889]|uniref:Uncharacterized protein n=1 Tax=Daedalea quercina L-15889 TaxID=1314783 RepID=A0A165RMS2_9APHY|nr:hypothetical protein DAEQUDRAFT_780038 [Daedalea quercina L-15889]
MASQPSCSCLVAPLEQSRAPLYVLVLGTLPPTVLLLLAFRTRSMKQRSLRRVNGTHTLANLGLDSSLQENIITVVDLSAAQPTLLDSRSFAHGTDPLPWYRLSETATRPPSSFLDPTSTQATARCKSSSGITGPDNINAPGGSSGQPHKPPSSRGSPVVEADDGSAALCDGGNTPSPLVSSGTSACRHGLIETDAEAWRKAFENILAPRVGASPIDGRPDYSVTSVQCKLSTRSASSYDTAPPATASSGKKLVNQLLCVVCAIVKLFVLACALGAVLSASIALVRGLVACIMIILMDPRWNVPVFAHSSSPKHYVVPV